MPKRAVFERSRRQLFLGVWVDVRILLVVEQSSLESQSRGYAKTPILRHFSLRYFQNMPILWVREKRGAQYQLVPA